MELSPKSLLIGCFFTIYAFQLQQCNGFYLQYVAFFNSLNFDKFSGYSFPALYSMSYNKGSPVFLHEKRVTGEMIPFLSDYGFCERPYPPIGWLEMVTLGETFSPYDIYFAKNVTCKHLCTKTFVGGDKKDHEQLDALKKGMSLKSKRHWVLDHNIPALWCPESDSDIETGTQNRSYCISGFPIGCRTGYEMDEFCYKVFNQFEYDEKYFIFNHVDIIIIYERSPTYPSKSKLVHVKVVPSSINHSEDERCTSEIPLEIPNGGIPLGQSFDIKYTYSIKFIRNDNMKWSSRWDYILRSMPFSNLHWIPLLYSILGVLSIILVPAIIITVICRDSKSYIMTECGESVEHELRWKLITYGYSHPAVRVSLSILLGSVFQLMSMVISALGFSLLAYVQPVGRDSQMLWALGVLILLGSVGGYFTSLFYRGFGGDGWKTNILMSCIICPGVAVSVFVVQDCILFFIDSSASLPFYSLSAFLGIVYLLMVPFTAIGYVLGPFKRRTATTITTTAKQLPTLQMPSEEGSVIIQVKRLLRLFSNQTKKF